MPVSKKNKSPKPKKSALGRGLSALIPAVDMALLDQSASVEPGREKDSGVRQVSLKQIVANPAQPRRIFPQQELDELAASIKEHGVLQPVLLRPLPNSDEMYEIVAGERRWRAAQAAALTTVPAIIRVINDQQALEMAIIENVQRQDISALDAAVAYRRLQQEFHLSQEEIATRVAKSRATIANTLRLLDLPEEVQAAITQNQISEGHGRAILGAKTDEARKAILRRVLRDGLTVRHTEELARNSDKATEASIAKIKPRHSADETHVEEQLQKVLGTRVQLKTGRKGGQIIISYFSAEELEGLLEHLGVQ
ncbi:MAG: ParB/RepB/Spo0J family partition protein [Abditibacteriaceae bacterium]